MTLAPQSHAVVLAALVMLPGCSAEPKKPWAAPIDTVIVTMKSGEIKSFTYSRVENFKSFPAIRIVSINPEQTRTNPKTIQVEIGYGMGREVIFQAPFSEVEYAEMRVGR